jgi:hypothetical protein
VSNLNSVIFVSHAHKDVSMKGPGFNSPSVHITFASRQLFVPTKNCLSYSFAPETFKCKARLWAAGYDELLLDSTRESDVI